MLTAAWCWWTMSFWAWVFALPRMAVRRFRAARRSAKAMRSLRHRRYCATKGALAAPSSMARRLVRRPCRRRPPDSMSNRLDMVGSVALSSLPSLDTSMPVIAALSPCSRIRAMAPSILGTAWMHDPIRTPSLAARAKSSALSSPAAMLSFWRSSSRLVVPSATLAVVLPATAPSLVRADAEHSGHATPISSCSVRNSLSTGDCPATGWCTSALRYPSSS
mmetsp:Transcript_4301/g.10254  ORF Transcript_4301/g.10254 Transcript_4301/m.10254 type:complete len:220 (+) Transcript_4301:330-989(+)